MWFLEKSVNIFWRGTFSCRCGISRNFTMASSAAAAPSSRSLHSAKTKNVPLVAVCQMTSTEDVDANLIKCQKLIARSKQLGADMTFLPECFDFVGSSFSVSWQLSSSIEDSAFIAAIRHTAKTNAIWVSLGGMHRRPSAAVSSAETTAEKVYNSHVVIDESGEIRSIYDKLHLYSVDIEGGPILNEHRVSIPGSRLTPPLAQTPVGVVGLQICYDLRFPEASLALTRAGAELLTYPSAFTRPTGEAHWESLLRTRAIENQCYVVAAAQVGRHNAKRSSYGHAMIVDPWGKVLVDCGGVVDCGPGVVKVAPIDLEKLRKIRREMPVWQHRRPDVYGKIEARFHESQTQSRDSNSNDTNGGQQGEEGEETRLKEDVRANDAASPSYRFGANVVLSPGVVFHETPLSFAFVNRKPVLPGHVLIAPKRLVARMKELTPSEATDFFLLSQRVSSIVESHFDATSCTLCVQDGAEAGQTVAHVHAHVLPRREGDLERNDDIYEKLAEHDKGEEAEKGCRSPEEMEKEAGELRPLFRGDRMEEEEEEQQQQHSKKPKWMKFGV